MFHRKARGRCMRGERHGWGEWGGGSRWGRRHGGGGRMFEQGDLRLVVLALLGDQPRHGYELIKEIEALSGGAYAPSPGVIYPLLTMLEEMGLARIEAADGAKKQYALTDPGREDLASKRAHAEHLLARLAQVKESVSGARSPQIMRAWENLRYAIRLRLDRDLSDQQAQAIAAALDQAASQIERT